MRQSHTCTIHCTCNNVVATMRIVIITLLGYLAYSSASIAQIIDQADYAYLFDDYDLDEFNKDEFTSSLTEKEILEAKDWKTKTKANLNLFDYTHFSNEAPKISQLLDSTFDSDIQYTYNGTKITASGEGSFRTDYVHTYGTTCGTVDHNRIVNGEVDDIRDKPWMMSLLVCGMDGNCFTCGAALLSDEWALTAGHCLVLEGTTIDYVVAFHSISEKIEPLTNNPYIYGAEYIVHAEYKTNGVFNDIALIRFTTSLPFSERLFPICLPHADMCLREGVLFDLAGWGTTSEGGSASAKLLKTQAYLEKYGDCAWFLNNAQADPFGSYIQPNEICAGGKMLPEETDWSDTCQGDSGGPMTFEDANEVNTIMGIVSWGFGCARPGYPGVYTRVTNYVDWIYQNSQVRMSGDGTRVPSDDCLDLDDNAGFTDLTGITRDDSLQDTNVNDANFHIFSRNHPKACLGKNRRKMGLDFQKGKFLVLTQRCDLSPPELMNTNYEFEYDSNTSRIMAKGFNMDDYCVHATMKNIYVIKCHNLNYHNGGIRPNSQWDYLPESGALITKRKYRGNYRAIYYPMSLVGSGEIKMKIAPFNFNMMSIDASNNLKLSSEMASKLWNDGIDRCARIHHASNSNSIGEMAGGRQLRMVDCNGAIGPDLGKWIYDSSTGRIIFYTDSYDPNASDNWCLIARGNGNPVFVNYCNLMGSSSYYANEYFQWDTVSSPTVAQMEQNIQANTFYSRINGGLKQCMHVNQRNQRLYVSACTSMNTAFGTPVDCGTDMMFDVHSGKCKSICDSSLEYIKVDWSTDGMNVYGTLRHAYVDIGQNHVEFLKNAERAANLDYIDDIYNGYRNTIGFRFDTDYRNSGSSTTRVEFYKYLKAGNLQQSSSDPDHTYHFRKVWLKETRLEVDTPGEIIQGYFSNFHRYDTVNGIVIEKGEDMEIDLNSSLFSTDVKGRLNENFFSIKFIGHSINCHKNIF